MRFSKLIKNENGQMTLEMALLAIALMGGALFVGTQMRDRKIMQAFTQGPWSYLQGMTQAGVWAPVATAKELHPNKYTRVGTVEGDESR